MDVVGIGPDHYCPGCTWVTDNVPSTAPALLADKGITWVTVSDMPPAPGGLGGPSARLASEPPT